MYNIYPIIIQFFLYTNINFKILLDFLNLNSTYYKYAEKLKMGNTDISESSLINKKIEDK